MSIEKSFKQAEVNAMLARARKEWEVERTRLEADHTTVTEAARARVAELESQLSALTGERDAIAAQAAKAEATRAQLTAERDASVALHRGYRAELELMSAFKSARVLTSATKAALKLFLENADIEQDDTGAITAVTYGGERHEGRPRALGDYGDFDGDTVPAASSAAMRFLQQHDYLRSARATAGTGTVPPNSGGRPHIKTDITQQRPEDLVEQGWKESRAQ
jgi:uncharacterized protein